MKDMAEALVVCVGIICITVFIIMCGMGNLPYFGH